MARGFNKYLPLIALVGIGAVAVWFFTQNGNGTAMARSRQLYEGRVVPSQAYQVNIP